ncbi:hypothetical protein [Nodosilinea sp. E11]|nr:hypothetical protein [Nodosilinea sp. E11]WOD40654.1 hypothetical protein RRF56_07590 [Nodosilinea sp. E11]
MAGIAHPTAATVAGLEAVSACLEISSICSPGGTPEQTVCRPDRHCR